MSYIKTEWDNGDIITAEKLNNVESGIEEINVSYEKTTWETGDTITAEKLNNIETGIEEAGSSDFSTAEVTLDATEYYPDADFPYKWNMPVIQSNEMIAGYHQITNVSVNTVPLYKGAVKIDGENLEVVSGSASSSDGWITIDGDCALKYSASGPA